MVRLTTRLFISVSIFLLMAVPATLAAEYQLSMLPRYSTGEINKRITALAEYLSDKTGLDIQPTVTSTFDQYLKKLTNGSIAIGFQNPYIYVLAGKQHEVVAMAIKGRDGDKFRGIIVTAANSPLHAIQDLKNKKIAIVGYTSAGGYLSQKLTLLENNIDVQKDCSLEVAPENKQENVAFAVFTGDVDAGFMRESALGQLDEMLPAGAIQILASTSWLPNWALSVSHSMPSEDRDKIVRALAEIKDDSPVLKTLKIKGFRPARDSEYDPVRKAAGLDQPADEPDNIIE
jgi:phosphonate transport system substrate-binding protein